MEHVLRMVLAVAMGIGLLTAECRADVFMRQKHQTDGVPMMGQAQPPRDFVQKTWLTADRARSDMESQSVIVRLDKGVTYLLDHSRRVYAEIPLDSGDPGAARPRERDARDRRIPPSPGMSLRITDTGETRRINEYRCRKYIQTMDSPMGPVTTEIWATEDLKLDSDLHARFSVALMAARPGGREAMRAHLAEMRKVRGAPVLSLTTSRIGGTEVKSRVELIELREERAPASIFEIPAGYSSRPWMGPGAEPDGGPSEPPRRR
ncbi:MAG: DUF4412 domain-containing protein [Syntrophobacteraceae bacterium]|jgi:hypothetical protein|nr:DUF4412 domain-containing protein [Syntrophobacteraceae bacterium]